MTRKSLFCTGTIAVLVLALVAVLYKVFVAGATGDVRDGRRAVVLEPDQRTLVLGEMRAFLAGLQQINAALTEADMATVARTAEGLGMRMAEDTPTAVMARFPADFKSQGLGVHRGFDRIAMDARDLGDPDHTLRQVSDLMARCVACHAGYRFTTGDAGGS